MDQPASLMRVQKAVEAMVEDVQRVHLVPRQKQAFLCCAQCCDTSSGSAQDLQTCVERCSQGPLQQQKAIQAVMQDFQERFQRCVLRCQDSAREISGFDPTPAEESKAKTHFNSCVDGCGKEFEGKVPKLKSDIQAQLRKL